MTEGKFEGMNEVGFRRDDFSEDPENLDAGDYQKSFDEKLDLDLYEKLSDKEEFEHLDRALKFVKESRVARTNGMRPINLLSLLESSIKRADDAESIYFATESLRQRIKNTEYNAKDIGRAILNIEIPRLKKELEEAEEKLDELQKDFDDNYSPTKEAEFRKHRDEVVEPKREELERRLPALEELAEFLLETVAI